MKVKTLLKKLKSYDPEKQIVVMVAAEMETGKNKPTSYDYLFAGAGLKVKRDKTVCRDKEVVLIYGDVEEIIQG